VTKLLGLSNY